MKLQTSLREGFSLVELMAVLTIVGLLATVILPRMNGGSDSAKTAACHTYKGDIEIQTELWKYNTGTWPVADLSNIGGDLDYFPVGLPICPVDQTPYTIDDGTGRVIGHNH